MSKAQIEDKLSVNKYDIDKEVHVHISEEICDDSVCSFQRVPFRRSSFAHIHFVVAWPD